MSNLFGILARSARHLLPILEEAVAILSRWGWFRAAGITCEPWEVGPAEWDQVAAAKPWEGHKRGQRAVPREVAATPSHDELDLFAEVES